MVYKKFYVIIILRIIIISALSCIFFFSIANSWSFVWAIIAGFLFLFQVFVLIAYINKINRMLENFFNFQIAGDHTGVYYKSWKKDEYKELNRCFDLISQKLKKAKMDYEIQNKYFETVVDHIGVGLISFAQDGNIELFNNTAKQLFGINIAKHVDKLDHCKKGFGEELLKMKPSEPKIFNILVNGEQKQLLAKLNIFKTNNSNLSLISFQNIKSELEQKEIESWQKLIRVLTHEIMNSISPITSLTNSLIRIYKQKEGVETNVLEKINPAIIEKTVKGLEIIEERGNGLMHFVDNYRSLTLLPKPEFQKLVVLDLFIKMEQLFEPAFTTKNIKTAIKCDDKIQINADSKLMEQMFINLIQNAVDSLENVVDSTIHLTAYRVDEQVVLEVSDNGKGIPTENIENIFVPFFTTKEKGSGIGLSLSRQIMILHQGTISVKTSSIDTTFVLKFRN
jgi:nitrogen fixation/metabolism regulation signal transduction histidine kinase